jgi:AraC-like DNA-binding protein
MDDLQNLNSMSKPKHPSDWRVPRVPQLHAELLAGACAEYDSTWGSNAKHEIRDDFARLYTLDSGKAEIAFANGTNLVLVPGMLGLIPAGRSARYRCTVPMRLAWVHFRVEFIPTMDCFALWNPPVSRPCAGEQRSLMNSLLVSLDTQTPAGAFTRGAGLLSLLTPFLPSRWQDLLPPSEAHQRLQPALDALTTAPSHAWDLATLAHRVHLHPTYFSNLFRETFGMSPLRYLGQLRLRRARELLRNTSIRIGEIAELCGYRDPLHFSRVFHKGTGVSPTEFRNSGGKTRP